MTLAVDERASSQNHEPEAALRRRVARLSLEEKVRLLTGSSFWSIEAEPKAGLRRFVVSDGPVGVRGEAWDDRDWSANGPSPTAVAASWDPELVERIGHAMGYEARRKGVDVILAPTVNLHRTPVGGRHFECYSEDPLLSGAIGAAWVRGVQSQGVGTCVKHFVANDQETERMGVDNVVDERPLRELYLAPFEHIERNAKPWSYMAAYNKVNGTAMTESPLLDDVLKGEWASDALVMSDWFATRTTVEAANAGLDLAMPGPVSPWGRALVDAVRAGGVDEAKIDEKVVRLLRLAARTGAVDGFEGTEAQPVLEEQMDALLREAAAAGFVLVKNDGILPLPEVTSLAVVGPNAVRGRIAGGGSASVMPRHVVHPADALAAALPAAQVRTGLGVRSTDRAGILEGAAAHLPDGSGEGLLVEFLDPEGNLLASEQRRIGQFVWMDDFAPGVPADRVATVRTTTRVTAARAGAHRLGASGIGHITVALDGEVLADENVRLREGADIVEGLMLPPQLLVERELAEGESVLLTTTFSAVADPTTGVHFWAVLVNAEGPHGTDDEEIAAAVELARTSDAAVVVVGTTEEVESEGYDRESLALPGRQDELVEAVIDANPNTVVVVNAGAPVLMPWLAKAKAVLLVWFPGQQMGAALADVLTGVAEPGGRMPTTWPAAGGVVQPENIPAEGTLRYDEGLHLGYKAYLRQGIGPAVPFGHGLGYTTWRLSDAGVDSGTVHVEVTNTGDRAGSHVVQVYVSRPESAVERPAAWLAAFARVSLEPGEFRRVEILIPTRAFEHWDAEAHGWVVEPGEFVVEIGSSVADRTHAGVVVAGPEKKLRRATAALAAATLPNPLIAGFHPDPSACRAGEDVVVACSSFEYLPGIPIYRGPSLTELSLVGHAAMRPGQLDVASVQTGGGAWAPTIREHDRRFWLVVADMLGGRGNLLFTADDPAGPWSDGIRLQIDGIDPDIAWDEAGACYVTYSGLTLEDGKARHLGILQVRIDPETGEALEEPRSLWSGTGGMFPEAPHLYRVGEWWYLLIAEGGTERGHSASVARAAHATGPFEGAPHNPLVTARGTDRAVQNTGHGDFVQLPDGSWVMVLLGTRPRSMTRAFAPMGRETFVVPVRWEDGWPHAEPVRLDARHPAIDRSWTFEDSSWDSPEDRELVAVRAFPWDVADRVARPGWLRLTGRGAGMGDPDPVFVGIRQSTEAMSLEATLDVSAGVGGLSLRYDEGSHLDLEVSDGQVTATIHTCGLEQSWSRELATADVHVRVRLRAVPPSGGALAPGVSCDRIHAEVFAVGEWVELGEVDGRFLSSEVTESFTGRVVGVYARTGAVDVREIRYEGQDIER